MVRLLVVAAAGFATWLAWIAFGVLCEEGCTGRPWPLVAQLVAAGAGLPLAIAAAITRARALFVATALVYARGASLLAAAPKRGLPPFGCGARSRRAGRRA